MKKLSGSYQDMFNTVLATTKVLGTSTTTGLTLPLLQSHDWRECI
ncbi:hypothetical protein AB1K89_09215 [Sporosarcina sp. 179-K 8C2 HS]